MLDVLGRFEADRLRGGVQFPEELGGALGAAIVSAPRQILGLPPDGVRQTASGATIPTI